jgi:hypothetical protein
MFLKTASDDKSELDKAIDSVLIDMNSVTSDSEEYAAMADQLVKLMKLKKEIDPSWRPSADTLAIIASNLFGILLILNFERAGVVASKALGFITKLK